MLFKSKVNRFLLYSLLLQLFNEFALLKFSWASHERWQTFTLLECGRISYEHCQTFLVSIVDQSSPSLI